MNARSFLDTNILVYAFDQLSPQKSRIARELITDGATSKLGIISYQVAQEFANVALRRFAAVVSPPDLELFLLEVLFPMMEIHSSPSLLIHALHLHGGGGLSWYDSLIVAAALQGRCQVLYSENFQDGRRFGDLRVENPFR